jgi:hypothetical protein
MMLQMMMYYYYYLLMPMTELCLVFCCYSVDFLKSSSSLAKEIILDDSKDQLKATLLWHHHAIHRSYLVSESETTQFAVSCPTALAKETKLNGGIFVESSRITTEVNASMQLYRGWLKSMFCWLVKLNSAQWHT